MRDLLRDGVEFGNRSEAVRSVILSMVNNGWAYADFHREMANPANMLGWWFVYRSNGALRTEQDRHRRLREEWQKGCRYVVEHPSAVNLDEAWQLIGLWRAEADRYPWAGRSALRNQTLLGILYDLGTEQGSTRVGAGIRTLCERSPFRGAMTVHRGLVALSDLRMIETERRLNPQHCNAYQLLDPGTSRSGGSSATRRSPSTRRSGSRSSPR